MKLIKPFIVRYIWKLINNMDRKAIDIKVRQLAEIYSSTILSDLVKGYPNLDPTLIEVVKGLLESGYIDGATTILDGLKRVNSEEDVVQ